MERTTSRALSSDIMTGLMIALTFAACGDDDDAASSWQGEPAVEISEGIVEATTDVDNTWLWPAIPFAAPPLGELRWKAPRPPAPWSGVRQETELGPLCPQISPIPGMQGLIGEEDCLHLNVWRPQSSEDDLPVYVWIYGGGNTSGGTNETPLYFGARLAAQSNAVFVSINYRLNVFGWFVHPALASGDPDDDSGNFGTLDLITGLEWIQRNIHAFGGDPNRVTIAGESAGSWNVMSLLLAPRAEGLFHAAIAQSGILETASTSDGARAAEDITAQLLVNDGEAADLNAARELANGMERAALAAYLRSKSFTEILGVFEREQETDLIRVPNVFADGHVLPAAGEAAFISGEHPSKVPIMMGSTKEESKVFLITSPIAGETDEVYQAVAGIGSDLFKVEVDTLARILADQPDQPPVYVFHFHWGAYMEDGSSPLPPPWDLLIGAGHSLDIPFFLGNAVWFLPELFTDENLPGRIALTDAIMEYQSAFIRGDPLAPAGLPSWDPWSNARTGAKTLILDADATSLRLTPAQREFTRENVLADWRGRIPADVFERAFELVEANSG